LREFVLIHWGKWSWCAVSLRQALEQSVRVMDYDILPLARRPRLVPARLRAMWEAAGDDPRSPWSKTATWSAAVQRTVNRTGLLAPGRPLLFLQTLPAFVLDPALPYAIYTDRVGIEGAAVGGRYASHFTTGWLERERLFLRRARWVFTMGPSTRDVLVNSYGVPAERIQVLGTAPNMALGPPIGATECRSLLFVGTHWRLKGGPELLQAFAAVRREFPHLELLIVGSVPPEPPGEGVRVIGRVPLTDMDGYYSQADALVVPTYKEGFGTSFLEGLIKGLPCVGTTVGNLPWFIDGAGECVAPGNVEALTEALRRLVAGYAAYRAQAARRAVELRAAYTWPNIAAAILETML
jgi:glycosyltransferase involved in cell wall biosynthesis